MTLQNKILLLASIGFSYNKVLDAVEKLVNTGKYTEEQAIDSLLEKNNIIGVKTDEDVLG